MDACHINNREQYLQGLEAEISKIQLEYQRLHLEHEQLKNSIKNRKEVEEGIISDTVFYRAFHGSPVPMCIATFESGIFLDVNQSFADAFGYQREAMIGKSTLQLGIWADMEERRATLEKLHQQGTIQDAEYRFKRKTGEVGYCIASFNLTKMSNEEYLMVSLVDITERKKAELDLIIANQKFAKLFNGNQTAISISRLSDGLVIDVNQAYLETMGFERDEIIGKTASQFNIWRQSEDRRKMVEELLEQGHIRNKEYSIYNRNGETCHVIASMAQLEIDSEIYIFNSFQDITQRKRAEEDLKASEEKFSTAFHNSKAIMSISRLSDGVFVDANNAWAETLGYEPEELIGKSVLELGLWAEPAQRQVMTEELNKYGYLTNFESIYRNKSGEIGYSLASINLISLNDEPHLLITAIDITEMKRYANEIKRLDNLNLIGQMAGSIAHEIRNPMTSIRGFLQLFQEQYKYREDREVIELMIEELDRVNDIISDFLSMSKINHIQLEAMILSDCIGKTIPLIFADAIKNDVIVDTRFEDKSPIMIDKGEIKQLLLNLVRNAIEAMPSGGTLTIHTFEDTSGVNLVVGDEGNGIAADILDKIWDPFLTTKTNGTGLGMPVCRSIAERHNATITFATSPAGTSFKVTFPVATMETE